MLMVHRCTHVRNGTTQSRVVSTNKAQQDPKVAFNSRVTDENDGSTRRKSYDSAAFIADSDVDNLLASLYRGFLLEPKRSQSRSMFWFRCTIIIAESELRTFSEHVLCVASAGAAQLSGWAAPPAISSPAFA
jgi:hypothetical protein